MKEIFNSGGGTQSACIAALIVKGRLPKPDYAVIVDTERERPEVWEYHDAVIVPALDSVGVTIHRVQKSQYATVDLFSKETLLLPVFSNQSGTVGKLSSFCSDKWKRCVMERFMREIGVPTNQQRNWIGFSTNESIRAIRMMRGERYAKGLIRFPLIHDVPLKREKAIEYVESIGWPTPPRSACWMCPNQSDNEWRDLKINHPVEFQMACELEKEIQKKDPFAWFHKSCVPLSEVDFSQDPELFERACNTGNCFV
jgi:hypothetical protein